MKLAIIGILLILGGIPNIANPENTFVGIVCVIIGILFVAAYANKSRSRQSSQREESDSSRSSHINYEDIRRARSVHDEYDAVCEKWRGVTDEHYRLSEAIGVTYTVANNLSTPDSPQMQSVIDLCLKDIAIADLFKKAQIEQTQAQIAAGYISASDAPRALPSYPAFRRLAIIYEKQKKYDEAIEVCQKAIDLGYVDDGTDGQMPGRIARLIRKKGKSLKKIEAADQIIIEDNPPAAE